MISLKNQMGSSLVFTMDLLLTVVQVLSEADFARFMIACRWNFSKVNNKRFQG